MRHAGRRAHPPVRARARACACACVCRPAAAPVSVRSPTPPPGACRYGQQRTVQLYRFLVDATIDTEIFRQRRGDEAEALLHAGEQSITADADGDDPMDEE